MHSDSLNEGFNMGLRSKLEIEHKGMLVFTLFYLIAGVANFVILGVYGLDLFHVALVAILSLTAAFGLYRLQSWSLWLVIALFFITTTYGALMLNVFLSRYTVNPDLSNAFAIFAWASYLLLTWMATIYVGAKRKNLK